MAAAVVYRLGLSASKKMESRSVSLSIAMGQSGESHVAAPLGPLRSQTSHLLQQSFRPLSIDISVSFSGFLGVPLSYASV